MKRLLLVIGICVCMFSCTGDGTSEPENQANSGEKVQIPEIYQQWQKGKAVVVIVDGNENEDSEQYADWSYYLNEFSSKHKTDFVFYKLGAVDSVKFEDQPEPYSVLFFKWGLPGFLYDGPVLEPQVYEFVQLVYAGEEVPGYLKQFAPEEVSVVWDGAEGVFRMER